MVQENVSRRSATKRPLTATAITESALAMETLHAPVSPDGPPCLPPRFPQTEPPRSALTVKLASSRTPAEVAALARSIVQLARDPTAHANSVAQALLSVQAILRNALPPQQVQLLAPMEAFRWVMGPVGRALLSVRHAVGLRAMIVLFAERGQATSMGSAPPSGPTGHALARAWL